MEIIRKAPADRSLIQRYRGGFTISGMRYDGSVLALPNRVIFWPEAEMTRIDTARLVSVLTEAGVGICLFGCGERMAPVPGGLRQALKDAGIGVDSMATGAACRTFNMLLGEGRMAGAVLVAL